MNKIVGTICSFVIFAVILNEVTAKPQHPPLRIINGTVAEDGEFPYMVQLIADPGYFYCGGSIIGDRWILTAGHCVQYDAGGVVVYGTNELAENKVPNTTMKIKQRFLHPQFAYNHTSVGNLPYYDVGIIELEHAIPFSAKARPIQLANSNAQVPSHKNGTLAGWGVNFTYSPYAQQYLQKTSLHVLSDIECSRKIADYGHEDVFNRTHNFCLDEYFNGQCNGDSGSPFVIDGIQYGIVSWGLPPCGASPGAYTRFTTPAYREFIRNVTGI